MCVTTSRCQLAQWTCVGQVIDYVPNSQILILSKLRWSWVKRLWFLATKLMLQDDCKWFCKRRTSPSSRTSSRFLFFDANWYTIRCQLTLWTPIRSRMDHDLKSQMSPISKLRRSWAESWWFLVTKLMLQDDCKWFWRRRASPSSRTSSWFLFFDATLYRIRCQLTQWTTIRPRMDHDP